MKHYLSMLALMLFITGCSSQKNVDLKSPCVQNAFFSDQIKCERYYLPGNMHMLLLNSHS